MSVFTKSQQKIKKAFLFVTLILFVLIWLFREDWQIDKFYLQILMFIFAYGLGLFLMLGDEKYLQKIYTEELEKKILITRSPLFLIILPFLSVFMLTSTGSIAGIALILALNLVILIEIYQLASQTEKFNQYFLIGIKKKISSSEIKIVKTVFFIYFLLLLFLLR
jgi:hypothetical protein